MALLKRTTALLAAALLLGTAACTDSDAVITDKVKAAIADEPSLKGTQVNVSTKDKVVHLSGTVKTRAERATLIAVARKVEGVEIIKNDLVIAPQQKSAAKPKPKAGVQAQAKQPQPAPRRVSPPPVVGD
jgi:hyperosmotically inducible protein